MSVKSFLTQLKTKKPLDWVTGNQSADLDSVISAITYAYFNYKLNQTFIVPLVNIPKSDFSLRRDINLVLNQHGITPDLLYFIEDFAKVSDSGVSNLALVDHCNLQGETVDAKIKVNAIIDHHEDENVFVDADPRIIQSCGSCSSLVFNFWYEKLQNAGISLVNDDVISMLIAPLVIDTTNMTQKVESPDIKAFEAYKELAPSLSVGLNGFFKQIKTAKKDLSGFKVNEILRKDYKQFNFGGKNIGFSSIGKSGAWLFSNYTNEEIINGIKDVTDFYKLQCLIITPSYTVDNQYRREFLTYHVSEKDYEHLIGNVASLELNDDVHGLEEFRDRLGEVGLNIKNQGNLAASRKQIVPVVKQAFS